MIIGDWRPPTQTLEKLAAERPAAVRYFEASPGEAISPIGIEFSPDGVIVTLNRVDVITGDGTPQQQLGEVRVTEEQLKAVREWLARASGLLYGDTGNEAPFERVGDVVNEVNNYFTAKTLDFLAQGIITVGEITYEGDLSLVEIVRTTGSKAGGNLKREVVVFTGDRLHQVKVLAESMGRIGDVTTDEGLARNLQLIDQELELDAGKRKSAAKKE